MGPARAAAGRPLFLVHGGSGNIVNLVGLARSMGRLGAVDGPIFGLEAAGLRGGPMDASITAMARRYVAAISAIEPHGPYLLGGFSIGGGIALEMAAQLIEAGERVAGVVLLDAHPSLAPPLGDDQLRYVGRHLRSRGPRAVWPWVRRQVRWRLGRRSDPAMLSRLGYDDPDARGEVFLEEAIFALGRDHSAHHLRSVAVDAVLVKSRELWPGFPWDYGWGSYVLGSLAVEIAGGDHLTMLDGPNVSSAAELVTGHLRRWRV